MGNLGPVHGLHSLTAHAKLVNFKISLPDRGSNSPGLQLYHQPHLGIAGAAEVAHHPLAGPDARHVPAGDRILQQQQPLLQLFIKASSHSRRAQEAGKLIKAASLQLFPNLRKAPPKHIGLGLRQRHVELDILYLLEELLPDEAFLPLIEPAALLLIGWKIWACRAPRQAPCRAQTRSGSFMM